MPRAKVVQPVSNFHIGLDPAIAVAQPQGTGKFFCFAADSGDVLVGQLAPLLLYLVFEIGSLAL